MGRLKFLMKVCRKKCGEFDESVDNCKHLHPNFSYQHVAKLSAHGNFCPIYSQIQYDRIIKVLSCVVIKTDVFRYSHHRCIVLTERLRHVSECLDLERTDIQIMLVE